MTRRAVLVAMLVLAACTNGDRYKFRKPPPPDAATTTTPDFSAVPLDAIPGRTTTSIDNGPGYAHLSGNVTGPGGAIPGATVRLQRLVGDGVVNTDIVTNPDGTWRADNIKGGRYRVRAWRPPDLAQLDPQVFFLGGDENKTLNLQLNQFSGSDVAAATAPNPPVVGSPANLVVQVRSQTVDGQGVVRGTPQSGASVQLVAAGAWRIDSPNPQTTDASGSAQWQLTCQSGGQQALTAVVNAGQSIPLQVRPCVDAAAPVVPPAPPTTTRPGSTTSSTRG